MSDYDALPYRPCVGVMLLDAEGRAFIGRRADQAAGGESALTWQMPQGGIDRGEDPYPAARRELYEETNVTSAALIAEAPDWIRYDLPEELGRKAWKGRYRGQTQKWFALRFTGEEREIDVLKPAGGAHKAEFSEWRWAPIETLPDLVVPFKRDVYRAVVDAFRPLIK